jgi:hypothetical protein
MSLHAQIKLKTDLHNKLLSPLIQSHSFPVFSFYLSGLKKNSFRTDTIKQLGKTNIIDTLSSENLANDNFSDLYSQAAKIKESNYPAFHNYYFKLPGFTGMISANRANLNWQTNINENVRYFLIERSTDRKNFNKIGEIDLAGKESMKSFYFTDSSISNSFLYYYHVKALLIDGSTLTSDIIPVKNSMMELKAFLSPGSEKDILVLKTNQSVRKIEVINTEGQIIFRNKKVSQEETINISKYLPGSYTLKILGHNGFVIQLFFKKAGDGM